ncbi:hypothetical protein [Ornithinimicrobium kibberense]|uniref:hypothetical protein n=1 Tax=Ornithinimicrobium kibberense TaxID=282060 RepID=UPI00360F9B5F
MVWITVAVTHPEVDRGIPGQGHAHRERARGEGRDGSQPERYDVARRLGRGPGCRAALRPTGAARPRRAQG